MPSKDSTIKIIFTIILVSGATLGFLYNLILKEIWLSFICTSIGVLAAVIGGFRTGRAIKDAERKAKSNNYKVYKNLFYSKVIRHGSSRSSYHNAFLGLFVFLLKVALYFLPEKKEKESKKIKSRKQTLSELYLVKVKLNLFKAKLITFVGIILVSTLNATVGMSSAPLVFLLAYILVLETIEKVMSYRINKGYFGANRYEAMQLLEFIGQNRDDDDVTGGSRKPFKDVEPVPERDSAIDVRGFAK